MKKNKTRITRFVQTYLLVSSLCVSFLFIGCEDSLEEDPDSLISLISADDETIQSLIVGMYDAITRERNRTFESRFLRFQELQAEYQWGRGGNRQGISNYEFDQSLNDKRTMWESFYRAIGRANILMNLANTSDQVTEGTRDLAIAEASFVRAIMYYQLVRIWGQVPLRLEPVQDPEEASIPLSPIDDIYTTIIGDLQIAELGLPNTADPGRATAGAAKAFLAEVYLTRGNFQASRDKAMEVIDNKATFGYDLVSDFSSLFSPTEATNSEDVFSVKFTQIIGFGCFHTDSWAPREPRVDGQRIGVAAGFSTASAFESGNASPASTLITGWDDNDIRKQFTLVDSVEVNGMMIDVIPQVTRDIDLNGDGTVTTERGLFTYGKFRDPGAPGEFGAGNDFYLMRYADVLLIFAEAENQVNGPTQAAIDALNEVRNRAYNGAAPPLDPADIASQQAFDDRVFQERGYEFMQEAKRWFDILRTNRFSIISDALKPLNGVDTNPYWFLPDSETLLNDQVN